MKMASQQDRLEVSGYDDMMSYLGDLDDHSDTEVFFKTPLRHQTSNILHLTSTRSKRVKAQLVKITKKRNPSNKKPSTPTRTNRIVSLSKKKSLKVATKEKPPEQDLILISPRGALTSTTASSSSVSKKFKQTQASDKKSKGRSVREDLYSVETIMGKKKVKGVTFYNVKWTGFDSTHNSWEPLQNFENLEVIEEYEEKLKQEESNETASKSQKLPKHRVEGLSTPSNKIQRPRVFDTRRHFKPSCISAQLEKNIYDCLKEFIIPLSGQAALASYERIYGLWRASKKPNSTKHLDYKSVTIESSF